MGNTIKNFEKKRRKERKEAQRIIFNTIMEKCSFPKELKEKEYEVFNILIK